MNPRNFFKIDVWECQECGWIISNTEMQLIVADLGCPECGNSFANFTLIAVEPTKDESNMSGGHFDYDQYKIGYIADEVEQLIYSNKDDTLNEYGYTKGAFYGDDVIAEFAKGLFFLKMAQIYAQRIDWLVSGDDGEESFLTRLKLEIGNLLAETATDTPSEMVPEESIETLKKMLQFCIEYGKIELCDCGWVKVKGCECKKCNKGDYGDRL
jgi:hypothetical protein